MADKISGNMVGIWLLLAEHLRLGTWDLLKAWSGAADEQVQTRLAMQLVNERALCVKGIRQKRTLSQKGFELANGLPFIATDSASHHLLDEHTVADAQHLQIALGKIRQTFTSKYFYAPGIETKYNIGRFTTRNDGTLIDQAGKPTRLRQPLKLTAN